MSSLCLLCAWLACIEKTRVFVWLGFFFPLFWDKVSRCSSGWLGTRYVDQASTKTPSSASLGLGLKTCAPFPAKSRFLCIILKYWQLIQKFLQGKGAKTQCWHDPPLQSTNCISRFFYQFVSVCLLNSNTKVNFGGWWRYMPLIEVLGRKRQKWSTEWVLGHRETLLKCKLINFNQ